MTRIAKLNTLSLGSLTLSLGLCATALWPQASPEYLAQVPPLGSPAVVEARQLKPLAAFSETTARPLFIPGRRPLPPPASAEPSTVRAPEPAPAPPPQLTILGIVGEPPHRVAIARLSDGKTIRLKEGQEIDRWRIVHIHPDRVVLSLGDAQREFGFPISQAAGSGTRPAPGQTIR